MISLFEENDARFDQLVLDTIPEGSMTVDMGAGRGDLGKLIYDNKESVKMVLVEPDRDCFDACSSLATSLLPPEMENRNLHCPPKKIMEAWHSSLKHCVLHLSNLARNFDTYIIFKRTLHHIALGLSDSSLFHDKYFPNNQEFLDHMFENRLYASSLDHATLIIGEPCFPDCVPKEEFDKDMVDLREQKCPFNEREEYISSDLVLKAACEHGYTGKIETFSDSGRGRMFYQAVLRKVGE